MSVITKEARTKIDEVLTEGRCFADTLNQTGLNMETEVRLLQQKVSSLDSGLFKTLVMGQFKTGKSTFINCIVGKEMMPYKATACTAVISVVEAGNDPDQVKIVFIDGHEEYKPLKQFNEEYQLSNEDYDAWESGARPKRFADISHVVMYINDKLFSDGFQLIDSPGTELDETRTQITNKFIPQADAIIFMLNAIALFSTKEREFIAENFAGKGCRNVFFVVNRVNQLPSAEIFENEIKPYVRKQLHEVFLDKNGYFDEELYNNRVFYVDAYHGFCARIGQQVPIHVGRKTITVEVEIEDTGIPEFEEALSKFLNSDERLAASFASLKTALVDSYYKACKQVELDYVARGQTKDQQERNASVAETVLMEAENKLHSIENRTLLAAKELASLLYADLKEIAEKEIPNHFMEFVLNNDELMAHLNSLNAWDLASLRVLATVPATGNRKISHKEEERLLQPIKEAVEEYIKKYLNAWESRVSTQISSFIAAYQSEIEKEMEAFNFNLSQAKDIFAYGNMAHDAINIEQYFKNGINVSFVNHYTEKRNHAFENLGRVLAICCQDMSLNTFCVVSGISIRLAINAMKAIFRHTDAVEQVNSIGKDAFDNMCTFIIDAEMDFKGNIEKQFQMQIEPMIHTARGSINDARNHMQSILNESKKSQIQLDEEKYAVETKLNRMRESIDAVLMTIGSNKPCGEEVAGLEKE